MRASSPLRVRPPSRWWSLGGTLAVHAAVAALILRSPPPRPVPRAPPPLEFRLQPRLRGSTPSPPQSLPPPRQPEVSPRRESSAPLPPQGASADAPRVAEKRALPAPPGASRLAGPRATAPPAAQEAAPPPRALHPGNRPPAAEAAAAAAASAEKAPPAAPEPGSLRGVNLLPTGVLRGLVEGPGAGPGPGGDRETPGKKEARLVQERVQSWLDTDAARYRATAGAVDPLWRDVERSARELFQPPEELVRSGQTTMTFGQRLGNQLATVAKQILTSPQRVEQGTLPRGEFAERGPAGGPEDSYRLGMAAQQQQAVLDAWKKPASWRRTEVELVMTASGEVESVTVVASCGAAKLDRLAAEAVERAARTRSGPYPGKRAVTRWAVESAYAANPPNQLGFSFDETGLVRKNARGIRKYLSDPQYLVGGHIETRVTLLSLHEPRG